MCGCRGWVMLCGFGRGGSGGRCGSNVTGACCRGRSRKLGRGVKDCQGVDWFNSSAGANWSNSGSVTVGSRSDRDWQLDGSGFDRGGAGRHGHGYGVGGGDGHRGWTTFTPSRRLANWGIAKITGRAGTRFNWRVSAGGRDGLGNDSHDRRQDWARGNGG